MDAEVGVAAAAETGGDAQVAVVDAEVGVAAAAETGGDAPIIADVADDCNGTVVALAHVEEACCSKMS